MDDILTAEEKSQLMSSLAGAAGVLFPTGVEQDIAELVDNAHAHSAGKVAGGYWSEEKAHQFNSVAINAAAASYAAARHIQDFRARQAIIGVLGVIRDIVNARIGFTLIPEVKVLAGQGN